MPSAGMDLESLVARFLACDLPRSEWTHAAHLAVGAWHVARYGSVESLARLRAGIRKLNNRHGTANTTTGGYHESITRAYVLLLEQFLAGFPAEVPLADRVEALWRNPIAARDVLLRFYTPGTLKSAQARAGWVEPDLRPLTVG